METQEPLQKNGLTTPYATITRGKKKLSRGNKVFSPKFNLCAPNYCVSALNSNLPSRRSRPYQCYTNTKSCLSKSWRSQESGHEQLWYWWSLHRMCHVITVADKHQGQYRLQIETGLLSSFSYQRFKVAEDDITFKLAIFFKNHCILTTMRASAVSCKGQN